MTIEIGLSKLGIRFINCCDEMFFGCFDMEMQGWQNNMGLSFYNCAIVTFVYYSTS